MAATDMYVTTTGAGTKAGTSWANAFSLAEFKTDVEGSAETGDRYFFKEGTYTFAADIISALDGSIDAPIEFIGVVSATTAEPPTASDWATGINRPLFDEGAHTLTLDNYWIVRNIRGTGTSLQILRIDTPGMAINCKFENTSGSASQYGLYLTGVGSTALDCECACTNGYALRVGTDSYVHGCYVHDSTTGMYYVIGVVNHCVIDTCTTGIQVSSPLKIINSTIYNCTTGIYESGIRTCFGLINCAIDSCTDGFKSNNSGTIVKHFLFDYNNWSNNTRDMSWDNGSSEDNSAKGANDTANSPSFTDAAGGDFSLQSSSSLIDAGFSIKLGVS